MSKLVRPRDAVALRRYTALQNEELNKKEEEAARQKQRDFRKMLDEQVERRAGPKRRRRVGKSRRRRGAWIIPRAIKRADSKIDGPRPKHLGRNFGEFRSPLSGPARAQVELKQKKSETANLKAQDDDFARTQQKLLEEWRAEMMKSKRMTHDRYDEERRVRDLQIAHKKALEQKDRDERRRREMRELGDNRDAIAAAAQADRNKREAARERLRFIQAETAKEQEARRLRKIAEGEEDKRLMHAYKEKLRREEEARSNAFATRMARLEDFAAKSSTQAGGCAVTDHSVRPASKFAEISTGCSGTRPL